MYREEEERRGGVERTRETREGERSEARRGWSEA